jgi:F0F1-type ATP synthase assembly protein I
MSAYASATFWPRGAIRTVVAIVVGIAVAVGAWVAGVPLLSGAIALFAAFMVAIFVVTLVAESRQALRSRDRVDGS